MRSKNNTTQQTRHRPGIGTRLIQTYTNTFIQRTRILAVSNSKIVKEKY